MTRAPLDAAPRVSAARGTLWAYIQNWSARGITLLVFFALARLLTPAQFGTFAVAMVFLTLGEIFVEQLFAGAIVQRETLEHEHLDATAGEQQRRRQPDRPGADHHHGDHAPSVYGVTGTRFPRPGTPQLS